MNIKKHLLPHKIGKKRLWRSPRQDVVSGIILHYISAINIDKTKPFDMGLIYDIFKKYKYSAHYIVDRDGTVFQMVKENNVAFHAGVSSLHGKKINRGCNDFTIGIELIGGQWIDYTKEQYDSLILLVGDIKERYKIKTKNIVGHRDIAPGRKHDPGKHFNWNTLFTGIKKIENDSMIEKNKRLVIEDNVKKSLEKIKSGDVPIVNNISKGDISIWSKINSWVLKFFNKE